MTRTQSLSRKLLHLPLALLVLAGSAGFALANHDPDFIHLCAKGKKLSIAPSASMCPDGATAFSVPTEAAIDALLNANSGLQAQVDSLESYVKRLHGYTAAVIESSSSGSAPGPPGAEVIRVGFCSTLDPNGRCNFSVGYELSAVLDPNDSGKVITFNASNTPDFPMIVDLLTNGDNDFIQVAHFYQDPNGNLGGGGIGLATERGRFFRVPQVTTGPGFDDLEGLDIGSISFSIDFYSIFFDQNTQLTKFILDFRVFFGLAP